VRVDLQKFKEGLRLVQVREEFFLRLKFARMHAAAAATQFHGMLQVQHLVIDDVFHGVRGNSRVIEYTAHDDGIVGGIVMAEAVAGVVAAPCHLGSGQQAVEESRVQVLENIFQIVGSTLCTFDSFTPAHLSDEVSFLRDVVARNVAAITRRLCPLDGLAVHFGQKDVRDGAQHRVWSSLQKIGKSDKQLSFTHADGVVDVHEGEEFNGKLRHGRARTQFAIGFLEDVQQPVSHLAVRLARTKS